VVESFNKTLHKGPTKIYGIDKDYWDDKVPIVLWAYMTAYKILIGHTPFKYSMCEINCSTHTLMDEHNKDVIYPQV
jgi:hypothetical protein